MPASSLEHDCRLTSPSLAAVAVRPTTASGVRASLVWRNVVAASALLLLVACSRPQLWPLGASDIVRDPARRPVIFSGRAGWPVFPVDPSVHVDDEGFHLFYTTFFCRREQVYEYSFDPERPAECDVTGFPTAIAYAFSADRGRTWVFRKTPVLAHGGEGFDALGVETATIFRMKDSLYLAYSASGRNSDGTPLTHRFQIGLARLALGRGSVREAMMDESRTFERRTTPLLPYDVRAGRFDNNVQEPSIVRGPDGISLYYTGLGLERPDQPIDAPGQKIRSVGLGRARLDEQLNVVSRSRSPILEGVNIAEVRYFGNAYHLFATTLTAGDAHRGEAITHATSLGGVTWSTPRLLLSPGAVRGYDDWGMMAPTVAVESDRLVLFYTAFGTSSGACRHLGRRGRFGIPAAQGRCLYPTIGRVESSTAGPRRSHAGAP